MTLDDRTKKHLIVLGIFCGIVTGMFLILFTITLLARKSWNQGLKVSVQETLDRQDDGRFQVEEPILLKSASATATAIYKVSDAKFPQADTFALIVRLPTIAGPQPAVFLYSQKDGAKFYAYAIENGKAHALFDPKVYAASVGYWEERLPRLIKKNALTNSLR